MSIGRVRARFLAEARCGFAALFEEILPPEFLVSVDPTKRQRSFGHIPVFWAWVGQIFEANASCHRALSHIQAWYQLHGQSVPSGGNGGFCRARLRIRVGFLERIAYRVLHTLRRAMTEVDYWHGFEVKAIDGSSVQLMDTEANQEAYPQPAGQKPGCGFPVMGIAGLLNLSHGGWEAIMPCDFREHDARVAPRFLEHMGEGELLLGDRAYCSYQFFCQLRERKAHAIMRLHQARHRVLDWRRGKRLGKNQRLVTWTKPVKKPDSSEFTDAQWNEIPDELEVRLVKKKIRDRQGKKRDLVVATTLLDDKKYPAEDVIELYARRWDIEVQLRDVKTTLKMESFEVRTPEMAHKTLLMMTIASNLLRALMQQSAREADKPAWHMSFKGTLDLVNASNVNLQSLAHSPRNRKKMREKIISLGATKTINLRPGRKEPRAVKKRPKPHSQLTAPRHSYKEIPHRETYRKAA